MLNNSMLYKSFTIIEILISLTIGTFIIIAVNYFYSDLLKLQNKKEELYLIQKDAHQLMDYFQQHIQHINFQGKNRNGSNYSFFTNKNKKYSLVNANCLMFFYDVNKDGCIGNRIRNQQCFIANVNNTRNITQEIFGFKLKEKNIHFYEDSKINNCYNSQCKELLTECTSGKWSRLNSNYNVDKLEFDWLKENIILITTLTLTSKKDKLLSYTITGYSYLLNSSDVD